MAEHDLREHFTLAELRNRMVNEQLVEIVDVLNTPLSAVSDLMMGEANDGDDDIVTRSLYEPQGSEVNYNQGWLVEHGQSEQVTEHSAIIEQGWRIEKKVAHRSGNYRMALFQEEKLQTNGLRKLWENRLFRGNRATAAASGAIQINGIDNRSDYNALNDGNDTRPWCFDNAQGATPSATANKTRIYFVKHADVGFRWFYPKGSQAGLQRNFFGLRRQDYTDPVDGATRTRQIYEGMLGIAGGISIKDPRSVVVIHNISMSAWDNDDDFDIQPGVLIDAMNYIDAQTSDIPGMLVCYMHSKTRARLWRLKSDLTLSRTQNEVLKMPEWMIDNIPIHTSDQINITGSKVT